MNKSEELLSLARKYAALPEAKRAAFRSKWLESGSALRLPIVPLTASTGAAPVRIPLSYAQERLWFLWRFDPSSAAYHLPSAVRLEGELDEPALRSAIDELGARHAVLRTCFEEIEGVAWQKPSAAAAYDFERSDLSSTPPHAKQRLQAYLSERSLKPFDLERGPLVRVALIRLGRQDHVLHFVIHHIVFDAWSYRVLIGEFAQLYAAARAGTPAALPAPTLQYADYAAWQREWLDARALEGQLAYWKGQLGREHPLLELPYDRKRSGARRGAGARVTRVVPADTVARLRRASQNAGATLFMTLLAAYALLLHRYSGQEQLRVGIPVAGRDRLETEGLIGFFVNTLVVRVDLGDLSSFSALLEQVRERVFAAQQHQELPFPMLVDALQPERSPSHTPLFQALFNHAAEGAPATLSGLQLSPVEIGQELARFDLVLNATETEERLWLSFGYATDVFDAPTIERLTQHYLELVEQIADGFAAALPRLALSREQPHAELARHTFSPVASRVAAQAAHLGAAPALCCEGERLSYAELDAWSNQIARALSALGDLREQPIGLFLGRSPGLVAALLGIWKAGAAFVPLDPSYPDERTVFVAEDARLRQVLVDSGTAAAAARSFGGLRRVCIGELAHESAAPFAAPVHPEQLAYVIYTSGSTGNPKGVAISQRSLSLHIDDFIAVHRISAADKVLHSSTINFDVALHEILPALVQGGQVEMRGQRPWDLEAITSTLAGERVTFSRMPSAYWRQWLQRLPAEASLPSLRQITVGGEGLPGDALAQWQAGPLRQIPIANLYGPTETTVACHYRQTTAGDGAEKIVPIGVPYPARSGYVMDRDGNEAPRQALGELWIGGDSVARGYLHRPSLTAERFVPDPFGAPGSRLYRSGDLCRLRADGAIDFLGRIDRQVKIRGFRVELEEIEAALRRLEGVREAVVELRGENEAQRLIGYLVGEVDVAAAQQALAAQLPSHMVPSVLLRLDALPTMLNGKLDRAALPEPERSSAREVLAPRTPLETTLLGIWQDVLGRRDFGVSDNFFEIGGNSLIALQIAHHARVRNVHGFKLEALFARPTVAALAEQLESGAARLPSSLVPLNSARSRRNVFAIHPVYGLVLDYGELGRALDGDVDLYGVQFPFDREPSAWPDDLQGLAQSHVRSLRSVQPHGPYHLLGWSLGGLLVVEMAHVLESEGEQLGLVGIVDAKTPRERREHLEGKHKHLQRKWDVTEQDLADFWRELKKVRPGWEEHLLARDGEQQLVQRIILATNYLTYVTSRAPERRILSDLSVWWSKERVPDLACDKASEWAESTHGSASVIALIEASHPGVLKHEAFIRGLRGLIVPA